MAYKKKGIDISRYQGTPDFTKVKNEVVFVLVQAGYGKYSSQKDSPLFLRFLLRNNLSFLAFFDLGNSEFLRLP